MYPFLPRIGKLPSPLQHRLYPCFLLKTSIRDGYSGRAQCEAVGSSFAMLNGSGASVDCAIGRASVIPFVLLKGAKNKTMQSSSDIFSNRASVHVAAARGRFLERIESIRQDANPAEVLQFESPLTIVKYPDPRLRMKNKRVNIFDENLNRLVAEMFELMYRTDGVGLSAPQVGVNVQLMVYNPVGLKGEGDEYVLVNPKIVKYARNRAVMTEGCLSFPQMEAPVERPLSVRVEAQDIKGKKFSIKLKDWQARIFQHEYDHLEGVLYIDRMSEDILQTIIPGLLKLEEDFEKRTGEPAPERIHDRKFLVSSQQQAFGVK